MRGSLQTIKVIDVLKLLAKPSYVGRVRLFEAMPGAPEGSIWLEHGSVVGARIGDLVGRDALYRLLDSEGHYESQVAPVPEKERNLHHLPIARLDEFNRTRKTQWSLIQARIPTLDAVPLPNPAFDSRLPTLPLAWQGRAIVYMDGTRSVAELAERAQIDPISICQFVLQLQDYGLIRPDVHLPPRYRAGRIRLQISARRPGKLRLSEASKRILSELKSEDSLAAVAERTGIDPQTAAKAAVDLIQQGALEVTEGEADLSVLAGAAPAGAS